MDVHDIFAVFDKVQEGLTKKILAKLRGNDEYDALQLDLQLRGVEAMRSNLWEVAKGKGLL